MTRDAPGRQFDGLHMGGLMRCCLETLDDYYPDGPAKKAAEGERLKCQYHDSWMIFRSGFWEWDRDHGEVSPPPSSIPLYPAEIPRPG